MVLRPRASGKRGAEIRVFDAADIASRQQGRENRRVVAATRQLPCTAHDLDQCDGGGVHLEWPTSVEIESGDVAGADEPAPDGFKLFNSTLCSGACLGRTVDNDDVHVAGHGSKPMFIDCHLSSQPEAPRP